VQPQLLALADAGDRGQRIDGAGVHRARRSADDERMAPGGAIFSDSPLQVAGVHAVVRGAGDLMQGAMPQTEQPESAIQHDMAFD